MEAQQPRREDRMPALAVGGMAFAACVLTLVGAFQVVAGLTAIFDDEFYVVARNYTFDLDTTAWGWIHVILGLFLFFTGMGLFRAQPWAQVTAISLAMLSALANFFFIPYFPAWSLLVIALNIWVIWSLTCPVAGRT